MLINGVEFKRNTYCGELRAGDCGRTVTVMGWCHHARDLGGMLFITVRDRSGEVQLFVSDRCTPEIRATAARIRGEFVLAATGEVVMRQAANPDMPTGEVEIAVRELRIISEAQTPPFYIEADSAVNEELRLRYRYLDLRRPDMQQRLRLRHRITQAVNSYLDEQGFWNIETPMLGKSTPEGARDYLVPSRVFPGSWFALPQSPQLYKQLLMVSGVDRYYQIARCFRDEDLRADRQPEFTQIDLEMSFIDEADVREITEGMLAGVVRAVKGEAAVPALPFPRMSWLEAMNRFGSDKPDLRFGMEIIDVTDWARATECPLFQHIFAAAAEAPQPRPALIPETAAVKALVVAGGATMSRRELDALANVARTAQAGTLAWLMTEDPLRGSIHKHITAEEFAELRTLTGAADGDLILMLAGAKAPDVLTILGRLRNQLAADRGLINEDKLIFLWITDFPLLEYDEDENRWSAAHHPFTSPQSADLDRMETEPGMVRARAYDVVLNGVELGGGSIRIHDPQVQMRMFRRLGFTEEQAEKNFGFLMSAFRYGVPPHGGIALGLDRLVMLMTGSSSLREVIAFPKVQTSADLMQSAPAPVQPKQLVELGIATQSPEIKNPDRKESGHGE